MFAAALLSLSLYRVSGFIFGGLNEVYLAFFDFLLFTGAAAALMPDAGDGAAAADDDDDEDDDVDEPA
uniref:Putative secreted peptide n=1 Tax=Anopheles braziliensis TaxID=58242 RepID=A0A2M3ZT23_9DIPT